MGATHVLLANHLPLGTSSGMVTMCATLEVVGLSVNWALNYRILNFTGKGMIYV